MNTWYLLFILPQWNWGRILWSPNLSVCVFVCPLYSPEFLTDFLYAGSWHHKEDAYWFWWQSANFLSHHDVNSFLLTFYLRSLYSPEFFIDVFYFWYIGSWQHKEDSYWFWWQLDYFLRCHDIDFFMSVDNASPLLICLVLFFSTRLVFAGDGRNSTPCVAIFKPPNVICEIKNTMSKKHI